MQFPHFSKKIREKWITKILNTNHNHEVELGSLWHAATRKLTTEEKNRIESEYKSGIKPAQILSTLKNDYNIRTVNLRSIYDETAKVKKTMWGGKSLFVALMEFFANNNYIFKLSLNIYL